MASLFLHILSSLLLITLGLWHLCCSCLSFLLSPTDFSARVWHPFPCLPGRWKHLPLYFNLVSFSVAFVYQVVGVSADGTSTSAHKIAGLQHAAMLAVFLVVFLVVVVSETTSALPLPLEASFLFAGISFLIEWMVLRREASPSYALEDECYGLLARLAVLCAASCLCLTLRPKAFLADLVLCAGIILQGTWVMQIGLSLFAQAFIPEGCHRMPHLLDGSTQCDLEEAKLRAVGLMDLAFICHAVVVFIVCVSLFGLMARSVGYRRNGSYDMLEADPESDHVQMKPLSNKLVID